MTKSLLVVICALASLASSTPLDERKERIIGGAHANAGQFPFIAAIYITTDSGLYFCSGALISDLWVVTAAQCVDGAVSLSIRLGATKLNADNSLRLSTDIYQLHPDFDRLTFENDIALIRFRLPITFTEYIQPVHSLPEVELPAGSSVITLGWGQTSDAVGGLVEDLNYVFLVSLTTAECQQAFGPAINDNVVCVDGSYNQGTCNGDLGSPLIQYGSRQWVYLVGVSSFISINGCESIEPSGFTRIHKYKDWIVSVTSANSTNVY